MGFCSVHKHRTVLLIDVVDDAVLVGQPNRIESLQITNQFLAGSGIDCDLVQEAPGKRHVMKENRIFGDRTEAGRALAERLLEAKYDKPVVLALPRGGVPVAAEVLAIRIASTEVQAGARAILIVLGGAVFGRGLGIRTVRTIVFAEVLGRSVLVLGLVIRIVRAAILTAAVWKSNSVSRNWRGMVNSVRPARASRER